MSRNLEEKLAASQAKCEQLAAVLDRLRQGDHPAIVSCDNCGCDWLDNGLNPIGCPYCKQSPALEVEAYLVERLGGEWYGKPRSIIDAAIYDPTKPAFWSSPEAQAWHRVTPLVPALAQQQGGRDHG